MKTKGIRTQFSRVGVFLTVAGPAIFGACFCGQNAQAAQLVAPNYAANSQIPDDAEGIFNYGLRQQTVYGASEFPPYPIVITEIQWRPDVSQGGPVSSVLSNIQVHLSTTSSSADQLSSTFDQNTGADDTMVFSGSLSLSTSFTTLTNGTYAFDENLPLQTPFTYDPSKGNLLIDFRNFSGSTMTIYDNAVSSSTDTVSRVYALDPNATSASNSDSGGGVIQITYTLSTAPPVVIGQPANQIVGVGGVVTFPVSATGDPPLSYQWFFNNTNDPIAGATNTSLTLANVQSGQAGSYFVQVSDAFGSTFSSNALLTVSAGPLIAAQPANQVTAVGGAATFSVTASGSPVAYQWFFDDTNLIVGATNASLTLTNVQYNQAGLYSVEVMNMSGSVVSSNADLAFGWVVPSEAVNDQQSGGDGSFNTVSREQTVYGAYDLPAFPIIISELCFRPDPSGAVGPFATTLPDIQLTLSSSPSQVDDLNSTFAANLGANKTVVYSGSLSVSSAFTNLSNGTKAFDIRLPLQTPFLYDPSEGNLLLDLQNFDGCTPAEGNFINAIGFSGDSTSRLYDNGNPTATSASEQDTAGWVVQVVYTPASVPPILTNQPINQTVSVGGQAKFSVSAVGFPPLSYQWFFNNTNDPIAGATNNSLTLANLQTSQSGNYFVEVSDAFGPAFSSNAVLTVTAGPLITAQPATQVAVVGGSATFSVTASGSPLAYQWFFNDTNLISGATNASLSLTNVQYNQAGLYSVQVMNMYGSVVSSNADLAFGWVVPSEAVNDQQSGGDGSFNTVSREQTVYGAYDLPAFPIIISELCFRPDPSGAVGPFATTLPDIQLTLSSSPSQVDDLNSTFAANLGANKTVVYSGSLSVSSAFTNLSNGTKAFDIRLPLQTAFLYDPSEGNLLLDLQNFDGCTPAEGNFINAIGVSGDSTSRLYSGDPAATSASDQDTAGWVVQVVYTPASVPPVLTNQPINQSVAVGGEATFSVSAIGFPPLSYQWFFNNTNDPIAGATNTSLTLANVQPSQSGTYFVEVSDAFGPTFSSNAVLTVSLVPLITSQPVSQVAPFGGAATFSVTASGVPLAYQWFFNDTNLIFGATNASLTLSNLQYDQAGLYSVQITNISGSVVSSNASLAFGWVVPSEAVSNQQSGGDGSFNTVGREQTVYGAYDLPAFPIIISELRFRPDPSGAGRPFATTLPDIQLTLSSSPSQVDDLNSTFAANLGTNKTIVYSGSLSVSSAFITLSNGTMAFDIRLPLQSPFLYNPSQGNLLLDLQNFSGCTPAEGNFINAIGVSGDSTSRLYSGDPAATSASDQDTAGWVVQVVYTPASVPPVLTNQPINQSVAVGGEATFSVSAIGVPPLSYQWFFNNTNDPIAGATNTSLTLTDLLPGQSGTYFVQVSDVFGSTFSSNAVLTVVVVPPAITSQPTNQSVELGGAATFLVSASGSSPLSYQWFFNNTNDPIASAVNPSLTLTDLQPGQSGNYFVEVTDGFGSTFSSNAVLTVIAVPVITTQPASQVTAVGGAAAFSVTAASGVPFAYQWFFDDTNLIAGATNASLTLTNLQYNQAGLYSVQVTNMYGSVVSSDASLAFGWVVPSEAVSNQQSGGDGSFNSAIREQTVYGAYDLPAFPIIISELRFRPDPSGAGGPFATTLPDIQLSLSSSQSQVDNLYSTFAANLGTNKTIVYSGSLSVSSAFITLSNGTMAFDIRLPLQSPFLYNPSQGNLLLDLQNFSGCTPAEGNFINAIGFSGDSASRLYNPGNPTATSAAFQDTAGYVLQVVYTPAPLPPTISGQPANRTNTVGSTATFTVTAGPTPLTYQWFFTNTNNPISGATNNSLAITNVLPGQAGNYLVEVTDSYGSTLSSNALLTVSTNPPVITSQPVSRTGLVGSNFTFSVTAAGSLPLSYQWYYNTNTLLPGATNASLVLTDVQINQAGTYSVSVSNAYGVTNSAFALLTLNFPVARILFGGPTNVMGGTSFVVPVLLVANGNENTLSFSMNFPTQQLSYVSIALGSGAADATFLPNTAQAASGKIGVSIELPDGETFAPGTQDVVDVTFASTVLTGTQSVKAPINFTNQPTPRLLYDAAGNRLATNFINSSITILPTALEADVAPRPNGNQILDIFDFTQVGRFVAGLDVVSNASEFQRADCAPKSTLGDGQLDVADWVQAGRYAAGIDSPMAAGGPTAPLTPTILTGGPRTVTIGAGTSVQGLTLTLPVTLQSQGNENGVGFSLNFDPAVLAYTGVAKGSATGSATLLVNSNQAASGVLGIAVALPPQSSFSSGPQQIATITFATLAPATNDPVAFADSPVLRAIADPLANELSGSYSNSSVTVNPLPVLSIGIDVTGTNALLSWPAWATGFNLQGIDLLPGPGWTNVTGATETNGSAISVTVPASDQSGYFRLQHP